ncbi:MAG: response regulator [Labilithrix sp.]|nr:response regulator [Labilithrix sp.]
MSDARDHARERYVLVVEDDRDIRDTIVEILESEGYAVKTACDGDAAIAQMRQARPAVVLLDLAMPRVRGEDVRKIQLADRSLRGIPTVVMSAADRLAERCVELAPAEVLAKPIRLADLLAVVRRSCIPPAAGAPA